MAVSIEDILLARARQDEGNQMSTGTGALIGAGLGATAGITMGDLAERLRPQTQLSTMPTAGYRLKPGHRMAGGLVGMILGGALGSGAAQAMRQNSPAAELLAKLQTNGELTVADQTALQSVLADTYSNTLGM